MTVLSGGDQHSTSSEEALDVEPLHSALQSNAFVGLRWWETEEAAVRRASSPTGPVESRLWDQLLQSSHLPGSQIGWVGNLRCASVTAG